MNRALLILGASVLAATPSARATAQLTLTDALRQADFVSIHVPLIRADESSTPTWHLINDETLRLMKPSGCSTA